jgi:hypothetical protein
MLGARVESDGEGNGDVEGEGMGMGDCASVTDDAAALESGAVPSECLDIPYIDAVVRIVGGASPNSDVLGSESLRRGDGDDGAVYELLSIGTVPGDDHRGRADCGLATELASDPVGGMTVIASELTLEMVSSSSSFSRGRAPPSPELPGTNSSYCGGGSMSGAASPGGGGRSLSAAASAALVRAFMGSATPTRRDGEVWRRTMEAKRSAADGGLVYEYEIRDCMTARALPDLRAVPRSPKFDAP